MIARVPHLVTVEEVSESMMKIHDLKPAEGSNRAPQARRARHRRQGRQDRRPRHQGPEGPQHHPRRGFEGGQMPLHMRVPKLKGFNNPFRVEYQAINLDTIEESGLDEVTPEALHAKGSSTRAPSSRSSAGASSPAAVTVKAHAFSKSAEAAITAAGGTVETLPLPWGDRRPPAKGNQFTNR
jgi:large subunit ribosomal protein L15